MPGADANTTPASLRLSSRFLGLDPIWDLLISIQNRAKCSRCPRTYDMLKRADTLPLCDVCCRTEMRYGF